MPGRKPGSPKTGGRQKGTPNKVGADVRALAREYTEQSIKTLALALTKAPEWSARINAAKILLERGWGAPKQQVELGVRPLYAIADKPMTAEEWTKAFAADSSPSGAPKMAPKRRS